VAEQSGAVVSRLVETMEGINASWDRIVNIVAIFSAATRGYVRALLFISEADEVSHANPVRAPNGTFRLVGRRR
jgi:hypothetical protein